MRWGGVRHPLLLSYSGLSIHHVPWHLAHDGRQIEGEESDASSILRRRGGVVCCIVHLHCDCEEERRSTLRTPLCASSPPCNGASSSSISRSCCIGQGVAVYKLYIGWGVATCDDDPARGGEEEEYFYCTHICWDWCDNAVMPELGSFFLQNISFRIFQPWHVGSLKSPTCPAVAAMVLKILLM